MKVVRIEIICHHTKLRHFSTSGGLGFLFSSLKQLKNFKSTWNKRKELNGPARRNSTACWRLIRLRPTGSTRDRARAQTGFAPTEPAALSGVGHVPPMLPRAAHASPACLIPCDHRRAKAFPCLLLALGQPPLCPASHRLKRRRATHESPPLLPKRAAVLCGKPAKLEPSVAHFNRSEGSTVMGRSGHSPAQPTPLRGQRVHHLPPWPVNPLPPPPLRLDTSERLRLKPAAVGNLRRWESSRADSIFLKALRQSQLGPLKAMKIYFLLKLNIRKSHNKRFFNLKSERAQAQQEIFQPKIRKGTSTTRDF
jgi:hypothetical protein